MRVAITGATGFTGGHTLKELVASGHEPVAFVRSRSKLDAVIKLHKLPTIEYVEGDITSRESLRPLLKGCDAVIHTAAVAATGKKAVSLIKKVNAAGSRNVLSYLAKPNLIR